MKKLNILVAFMLISMIVLSQGVQRKVLWEEFTSGSCGPCAGVNPQITSYWNSNPDVVVGIQYHMSWPASNDPMYLNNPSDNNARRGVYGVNSIPFAAVDGDRFADNVGSVSTITNIVQNAYDNDPSNFEMQLQYELNDAQDQMTITAMITAAEAVSGLNAKLYLPVIEKHIHLAAAQPNGEHDFYNVMKALIPSSEGTILNSDWEQDDYQIFQYTWDVFGYYDISQAGLIGFIQDYGSSKHVQQAAYGFTTAITPNFSNDMAVIKTETPQVVCSNMITPLVTIRNQGSDPITSATIKYSINDGTEASYNWSGNLNFLESASVELPEIAYELSDSYSLKITIENPNNTADQYQKNNSQITVIPQSAFLPQNCKLAILTDQHPEETTWDIKDSEGNIIAQGGPYTISSIFIEEFTWPADGCYTLTMHDAGGNGLDGGFYKIVKSNNSPIWVGNTDFGYETTAEFAYDAVMDVHSAPKVNEINIYPNPIVDVAQVEFTLLEQSTINMSLYNILGKKIIQIYNGKMPAGIQQIQVNTTDLDAGVYFVYLDANDQHIASKKITIVK